MKQKSESQARDLQKHIKDSASALTEFEKALVRKSEECNVSYRACISCYTVHVTKCLVVCELYGSFAVSPGCRFVGLYSFSNLKFL